LIIYILFVASGLALIFDVSIKSGVILLNLLLIPLDNGELSDPQFNAVSSIRKRAFGKLVQRKSLSRSGWDLRGIWKSISGFSHFSVDLF